MAGRICYHCKQLVDEGEPHDCWTTTESALTEDLSEDLQDAWQRLREEAVALGEQRVYASHKSIMFSRKSCYCFVRPKKQFLEVCLFLGRTVAGPAVRRSAPTSATKIAHTLHIRHRDQVEAPLTDWMAEAYGLQDVVTSAGANKTTKKTKPSRKAKARSTAGRSRNRRSRPSR